MVLDVLENIITQSASKLGYQIDKMRVIASNRPDLCDYQCDDVFKLAKLSHKSPIEIGESLVDEINKLEDKDKYFKNVEFVKPGFINMTLSDQFICESVNAMSEPNMGVKKAVNPELFFMDYGGPNVAKPLHVGHMRTAIVGESIKRIINFMGHKTIADVHLGDYGLQIGQVIYGIIHNNIDYNDIDIKCLDEIYPLMSALCKSDDDIKQECASITKELQDGNLEYRKLWKKILEVSSEDIKSIYKYLDVSFDLWLGESDSYPYLPKTEEILKSQNLLKESEGALVVNISKDTDKKELPPLLFKKSNGAYLYQSTDVASIVDRIDNYHPDHILYVVDNRQALHFEQVFRTCELAGIAQYSMFEHLGYGTVNGTDGKPYKTRNGDTPKLQSLFDSAKEILISKKESNASMSEDDINKIVNAILKFADLQNSRERDYIFDISKFSDVVGKTGPYILYTYLRINKIINSLNVDESLLTNKIYNEYDRDLRLKLLDLNSVMNSSFTNRMPNYIADYVYDLCVLTNAFYQNNHIIGLDDKEKQNDWINVLKLTNKVIKEMLYLLVIDIPTSM